MKTIETPSVNVIEGVTLDDNNIIKTAKGAKLKGKAALAALQLSEAQAESLLALAKYSFALASKVGRIKHEGEAILLSRGGSKVNGMTSEQWNKLSKEDRKCWNDARKIQDAFVAAGVTSLVKL